MLLSLLERLALLRKRQGASGIWTGVALAAYLLRQYQRRAAKDVVAFREELPPGETLVITHFDTPSG